VLNFIIQMADLDNLLGTGKKSGWTVEEFQAMDRKVLRYFAAWNGEATTRWPAAYDEMVKEKGFDEEDAALALRVYSTATSKSTINSRPDAYLVTQGGSFEYTPSKVSYMKLNGERVERANAPIPAKFGESDKYSNLVAVTAFCSQLVEVEGGEWKIRLNTDAMGKVFKGGELDVPGLLIVATRVRKLLSEDKVWITMPPTSRSSVSSEEMMCFVREALGRVPKDSYDALNTIIVCKALNTFRRTGKGWVYRNNDAGKRVIPSEVFEQIKPSRELERKLGDFPGCYWYLGGLMVGAIYPEHTGSLETTIAVVNRAREVQGSSTSPTAILGGMREYSGLTDAFGKRMQFVLATVLGLWAKNRKVNVRVDSVGDVVMLVSSLNLWRRRILEKDTKGIFRYMKENAEVVVDCYYKIVLSKDTDKANLNVKFHELIVSRPEDDAVLVFHHAGSLPTASSKGTVVDYDRHSKSLVPETVDGLDYVIYGPVYGGFPFAKDPLVKKMAGSAMAQFVPWKKTPLVYSFGSASNYHGVMSTVEDLTLIGWGFESIGPSKWDEREMRFVPVELNLFPTQKSWYEKVVRDIKAITVAWLNPISRYSPISNLPYVSKAGVTFSFERVEGEEGVLIGNILTVPSHGRVVAEEPVRRYVSPDGTDPEVDDRDDEEELPPRRLFDDADKIEEGDETGEVLEVASAADI